MNEKKDADHAEPVRLKCFVPRGHSMRTGGGKHMTLFGRMLMVLATCLGLVLGMIVLDFFTHAIYDVPGELARLAAHEGVTGVRVLDDRSAGEVRQLMVQTDEASGNRYGYLVLTKGLLGPGYGVDAWVLKSAGDATKFYTAATGWRAAYLVEIGIVNGRTISTAEKGSAEGRLAGNLRVLLIAAAAQSAWSLLRVRRERREADAA